MARRRWQANASRFTPSVRNGLLRAGLARRPTGRRVRPVLPGSLLITAKAGVRFSGAAFLPARWRYPVASRAIAAGKPLAYGMPCPERGARLLEQLFDQVGGHLTAPECVSLGAEPLRAVAERFTAERALAVAASWSPGASGAESGRSRWLRPGRRCCAGRVLAGCRVAAVLRRAAR